MSTSPSSTDLHAFRRAYGQFGEQERRTFTLDKLTARAATGAVMRDGLQVIGHAAVYRQPSVEMRSPHGLFSEYIAPHAFDEVLRSKPDVLLTWDHSTLYVLGRTTNGTLELSSNAHGLRYWGRVAPTSYAADLQVLMERGDVSQSSFLFSVAPGGEEWSVTKTGDVTRTVTKVGGLFDVCVCAAGAYPQTDSGIARSLALTYAVERGFIHQDPAAALRRAQLRTELQIQRRRLTARA